MHKTSIARLAILTLIACLFGFGTAFAQTATDNIEFRSPSVVLMDAASGKVLIEKNAHEPRAPASLTKIMTLLLAFEDIQAGKASLDDRVVASAAVREPKGTTIFLEEGEIMSLRDVLLGVAVASGNDAAVAVAEHLAGTQEKFAERMNRRARELGMMNTQFKNPHGLDAEGHYMSAYDMALLAREACKHPELLEMTAVFQDYLRDGKTWLVNRNRLVRFYDGADGLKTGHTTKAKYCLAATAKRDNLRLIAVVMGAPDSDTRFNETRSLLNYGFANFEGLPVLKQGQPVSDVTVYKGRKDRVTLVARNDLAVTVPKGEAANLVKQTVLPDEVLAPIRKGDVLGYVYLLSEGQKIGEVELVAAEDVPKLGFLGMLYRVVGKFIKP